MGANMKKVCFLFLIGSFYTSSLLAYEINPGDWLLKGVVGPSINLIHEDTATRATPGAGATLGLELDYMFDNSWSVSGAIRPMLAPGFIDLGFGIGAKYRWTQLDMPFIAFASVSITPAILIPVNNPGTAHFNLGLRPTAGCDYFVMRDLSVGVELAVEPSILFGSSYHRRIELTVEMLVGATWRF
jgi:hypothetical protein